MTIECFPNQIIPLPTSSPRGFSHAEAPKGNRKREKFLRHTALLSKHVQIWPRLDSRYKAIHRESYSLPLLFAALLNSE